MVRSRPICWRGAASRCGSWGPTGRPPSKRPFIPRSSRSLIEIGGVDTPGALLLLEASQAALGGLLVLGVLRLARLVAPSRPWLAWTAGLIVALHPTLVYAATHVQVALLGTTLLAWTLALAYQTGSTGRDRDAVFTGGLLALLALTDPILTIAAAGVAWAVWLGRTRRPGRLRSSVRLISLVAITALAGTSPWLLRNATRPRRIRRDQEHVRLRVLARQLHSRAKERTRSCGRPSSESSTELQSGSSLEDWNRTIWAARHEAGYIDDIALTRDDYRRLGSVSEPERSRILFRRALAELEADPARYGRLCLRRLRYFILFDETNPKSRILAYRVPHLGLTLLAGFGLVLAGPALRRRLMPTILTAALIVVFHTLTIVSARFHIPIEPLLASGERRACRWDG